MLPILDSAAANILKKVTWANIKATLKTYFDTLYAAVGAFAASGANSDITSLTALTAGGLPDNSVLTADIADAQVTGAKIAASTITPDKLAQPLTLPAGIGVSGTTSTDITGIPSWAKRIVLQIDGVSTNGTPPLLVQLGTSGGVETSGYYCGAGTMSSGITNTTTSTVGLVLEVGGVFVAGVVRMGQVTVTKTASTNEWIMSGVTAATNTNAASQAAAGKVLSGTLDRIRITTTGGATFTAGAIFALID